MRFLTILLFICGLAVFFWQNRQPIPLVFLGSVLKVQLPLALWVLLFAGAGAFTSLFLQALNAVGGSSSAPRARSFSPPSSPSPSPPPRQRPESMRSPEKDQPQPMREEWDDWNLEEPPTQPVARKPVDTRIQDEILAKENPDFEVQQEPQRFSQEGSVYSYSYRKRELPDRPLENSQATPQEMPQDIKDGTKTGSDRRNRVYDASYRIITPPPRDSLESNPPTEGEDDEEWI